MNRIAKTTIGGAALILLLSAAGPARAQTGQIRLQLVNKIAAFSGAGLFKKLEAFWLDAKADKFYALEAAPPTIFEFDLNGRSIKYFRLDETFEEPSFVGFAPDGTYLKEKGQVFKFENDFSKWSEAAFFFAPPGQDDDGAEKIPLDFTRIFSSKKGELYGYDAQKKNVYSCDADGKCGVFIRTLMKYGSEVMTGQIQSIYRDAWRRFFLVDQRGAQVWKFGEDGRLIDKAIQRIDLERDKLFQPELVAVDYTKRCFIYDASVRRLRIYDDLGLFLGSIEADQPDGPLFILPAAMEADDMGRLYVLDKGDMTIKIFNVLDM